jgi:hypothetical protein
MCLMRFVMIARLASWLTILSCASAQTVRITGQVMHSYGLPAAYEAVQLRLPGTLTYPPKPLAAVAADQEGKFAFEPMRPDRYELAVQIPGEIPLVQIADASAGNDVSVALEMKLAFFCDAVPVHVSAVRRAFLAVFHPAPRFRVSGRIVDSHGASVANAHLYLWETCFGAIATTDANGKFRIRRVFPGSYRLHVRGPGFLPVDKGVNAENRKDDLDLGSIVVNR